jgi:hypothetical protein
MKTMSYVSLLALGASLAGCNLSRTSKATQTRATAPVTPDVYTKVSCGVPAGFKFTPARFMGNNAPQRFLVTGLDGKKHLIAIGLFLREVSKVIVWDTFNEECLDPTANAIYSATGSSNIRFSGRDPVQGRPDSFTAEGKFMVGSPDNFKMKFHYSNFNPNGGIYTIARIEYWLKGEKIADSEVIHSWEDSASYKEMETAK